MHNFNKLPYKYLINTLLNSTITFALHLHEILHKMNMKMLPQKEFTTKHRMFRATNLHQPRKAYTTPGCDG